MKYVTKSQWILALLFIASVAAYGIADRIERGGLDVKGNLTVRGTSTLTGASTMAGVSLLSQTNTVSGITNKTFTSPTLTTPTLDIGIFDGQGSSPANPSAGYYKAYFKDDGKFYKLNSAGTEVEIGSGGAGGTNDMREYVSNGKFETDTTGWSTYADAASSAPANCTGGSPTLTGTRTTTAGEVIRETASYEIAKDAASQGEGVSLDFTLDYGDYSTLKAIPISFEYKTTSNYASGDILVYVYDVDAGGTPRAVPTLQSSTAGTVLASSTTTRWNGIFYPTTSTSDNYRLCFHVATTNASAWDFHLDSVHIGNQVTTPGPIKAYLGALTTTGSWVSNATYTGKYWRDGDHLVAQIIVDTTGVPTATALTLTLPNSWTIDTSKLNTTSSGFQLLEGGYRATDTGNNSWDGTLVYATTTTIALYRPITASGDIFAEILTGNTVDHDSPFAFGGGDVITINYRVPISNWSTGAALATTETLFSTVTVGASGDAAPATSGNPIIFPTETYDQYSAYNTTTGQFTAPKTGKYRVFGALTSASSATTLHVYVNAVSTALAGNLDSNGEATYSATVSATAGQTIDLRPGGTVDATASSFFIEQIPDFSIFSVYGISDYTSSTASATNLPTTTQYGDLTSITLAPGEWDLGFNVVGHRNTASEEAWTVFAAGISTTSGNSTSGLSLGENWMRTTQSFGMGSDHSLSLAGYKVTPTTSTTYYLKYSGTYSSNQPQAEGKIYARKIK